jgi:hypothetical protein
MVLQSRQSLLAIAHEPEEWTASHTDESVDPAPRVPLAPKLRVFCRALFLVCIPFLAALLFARKLVGVIVTRTVIDGHANLKRLEAGVLYVGLDYVDGTSEKFFKRYNGDVSFGGICQSERHSSVQFCIQCGIPAKPVGGCDRSDLQFV